MAEQEFVVKDRRRFTAEGENRDTADGRSPEGETPAKAREPEDQAERTCSAPPPLPEVNFSTFVFSLSTSALMHLGELPDPQTRETCTNLPIAKQTIDILGMLQEKTKGNLSPDEDALLVNLLYELRMKYVAAIRRKGE